MYSKFGRGESAAGAVSTLRAACSDGVPGPAAGGLRKCSSKNAARDLLRHAMVDLNLQDKLRPYPVEVTVKKQNGRRHCTEEWLVFPPHETLFYLYTHHLDCFNEIFGSQQTIRDFWQTVSSQDPLQTWYEEHPAGVFINTPTVHGNDTVLPRSTYGRCFHGPRSTVLLYGPRRQTHITIPR